MEFTIPAHMGSNAIQTAHAVTRKPVSSTKIETAPDAGNARADMNNSHQKDKSLLRPNIAAKKPNIDKDTMTGPPPTFQVNVLEMDKALQKRLAQMEVNRTQPAFTSSKSSDAVTETTDEDRARALISTPQDIHGAQHAYIQGTPQADDLLDVSQEAAAPLSAQQERDDDTVMNKSSTTAIQNQLEAGLTNHSQDQTAPALGSNSSEII